MLKRLERECYTIIPRETKAKDVTPAQIKAILSGIIQRNALVYANRARPYLMAAFNYGLKADNDPMNTNVGMTFGLDVNLVLAIPKQSLAEKWGVYVANACRTACHYGAIRLGDECRHR